MAKTYTCRDVGVDCDWKTSGATEDGVMASIGDHAAQAHDVWLKRMVGMADYESP